MAEVKKDTQANLVALRLDKELEEEAAKLAEYRGVSKSEVYREALRKYVATDFDLANQARRDLLRLELSIEEHAKIIQRPEVQADKEFKQYILDKMKWMSKARYQLKEITETRMREVVKTALN